MSPIAAGDLELWHDFFLMVGGGAAALTGLVFVAMSLNLAVIAQDATHRYRAIGTLTGFSAVFIACAFALMGGQGPVAVGVEWLVVAGVASVVYVVGYVLAIRRGGSAAGLHASRLAIGTGLYVAELLGAIALALGYLAGLYVATTAMLALLAWASRAHGCCWWACIGSKPRLAAVDSIAFGRSLIDKENSHAVRDFEERR